MSEAKTISTYPARIIYRATPTELLDQVKAELGEGITPFIFSAEISSNRLDAYYGHMGESTLRNFAADAAGGVPFLDSHNNRNLGYGQSFTGVFEVEGDISRVISDFFTIPGIHFGGGLTYQSTDDFILAKKARLSPDVSVGFYGGDEICDICGKSIWEWWRDNACPHIPGIEYPIGERGEQTLLATFTVEDSHLAEVSNVYDGATPDAMILKARHQVETGEMQPQAARLLETRYRIKLPDAGRHTQGVGSSTAWPGVDTNGKGKKTMTEPIKTESTEPMAEVIDIQPILRQVGAPIEIELSDNGADGLRWMADEIGRLRDEIAKAHSNNRELTAEVQRLQPIADGMNKYRADLIAETLAERVRGLESPGKELTPEEESAAEAIANTYRTMLENAPLEDIKTMRDAFKKEANKRLPTNGRQTVDDDQLQNPPRTAPATPDLAYAG